jgi:hypothetical protein
MRNLIASIAFAAAIAAGSTALAAPSKSVRQCFWPQSVDNFAVLDDRTVNVRVGPQDVYQLILFSPSPDIDWTQRIGIQSTGGSTICTGLDATLIVPSTIGPRRYPVTTVRKLSPDEVKALPARARP